MAHESRIGMWDGGRKGWSMWVCWKVDMRH